MIKTSDGISIKRVGGKPGDRAPQVGFQRLRAVYTASGGETSINLANTAPAISYSPGQSQLRVTRSSGGTMISSIDYFELTATSIGFPVSDPLTAGEIVEIIKEFSITGVMAVAPRQDVYTATATAGQTLINSTFSWPYNLNSQFGLGGVEVYLHGLLQTRGVDYTEVNLGGSNTNQLQFIAALVGGENIILKPTYQVIDQSAASSTFLGTQNAGLQASLLAGTQAFVDQGTAVPNISVPNTTIVNRAQIPNIAQDLKASFGIERIPVQQIYQLQNEFGPNGEQVFAAVNDDRGLIRFVGSWTSNIGNSGQYVQATTTTDYLEVSFFGTGVNLIQYQDTNSRQISYTVDGGGTVTLAAFSGSTVLGGRNYSSNIPFSVVSGLTLGLHTIRINSIGASGLVIYGLETLNANSITSLNANPGSAYISGQKYSALTAQSLVYSSGVTGTKGGRQLVYLKSDGTIGQAFQAVNAASAFTTSSDHTNEEVVRTYYWREFGAGRADDFSLINVTGNFAFTLDDGTTTLVGSNVANGNGSNSTDLRINNTGGAAYFITLTFVGTGCDIFCFGDTTGTTNNYTLIVDGASQGALAPSFAIAGSGGSKKVSLCSGLPYGTHTVKISQPSASSANPINIRQFVAYQPKKPSLPAGAVELADYNVVANFVSNVVGNYLAPSTGVIRKNCTREFSYTGTWGVSQFAGGNVDYFEMDATVNGSTSAYTFFGTGFDLRTRTDPSFATNVTATIDGIALNATNFPGVTFGTYGNLTFSTSTGVLALNGANATGAGFVVSGLTLGAHTIKFIWNTIASGALFSTLDIITPVHSAKSNTVADLQNTLPVGSQGLSDNRQTSMVKTTDRPRKNWVQAVAITSSPTTSSTVYVPVPDLSVVIKTDSGQLRISYGMSWTNTSAGTTILCQAYMDGVPVGSEKSQAIATAGYEMNVSDTFRVAASPGVHKIDLYFRTGGGVVQAVGVRRDLLVEEV